MHITKLYEDGKCQNQQIALTRALNSNASPVDCASFCFSSMRRSIFFMFREHTTSVECRCLYENSQQNCNFKENSGYRFMRIYEISCELSSVFDV